MTAYETKTRTAVRSLIWRLFGILLTILLALLLGGDLKLALELGIAYNAIRLVTHYFHDRLWTHIKWGLTALPPAKPIYRYKPDHLFPGEEPNEGLLEHTECTAEAPKQISPTPRTRPRRTNA